MDGENSNEPIFSIRKNASEDIHFRLAEYRGKRLCNIRVYYKDPLGEARPTRKGLTVRPELLPKIREGLDALEAALASEQKESEK